ncbi:hypothetical protein Sango_0640000 [Sesamum angolense]|uniref:Uncharacterized protein n=1 Tax=Sesamum angolense TaxID=2727404 RepID=A0AAE1X6W5_9LAMI|nr:hypothetical protein Sango_0640000 [Sesamum angolense]
MSPFQALYGCLPPSIPGQNSGSTKIASLDESFQQHQHLFRDLRTNLARARERKAQQANSKRRDHYFAVGDWVFLKLSPYLQHSVHCRTSQKLAKIFYGPYRVLRNFPSALFGWWPIFPFVAGSDFGFPPGWVATGGPCSLVGQSDLEATWEAASDVPDLLPLDLKDKAPFADGGNEWMFLFCTE